MDKNDIINNNDILFELAYDSNIKKINKVLDSCKFKLKNIDDQLELYHELMYETLSTEQYDKYNNIYNKFIEIFNRDPDYEILLYASIKHKNKEIQSYLSSKINNISLDFSICNDKYCDTCDLCIVNDDQYHIENLFMNGSLELIKAIESICDYKFKKYSVSIKPMINIINGVNYELFEYIYSKNERKVGYIKLILRIVYISSRDKPNNNLIKIIGILFKDVEKMQKHKNDNIVKLLLSVCNIDHVEFLENYISNMDINNRKKILRKLLYFNYGNNFEYEKHKLYYYEYKIPYYKPKTSEYLYQEYAKYFNNFIINNSYITLIKDDILHYLEHKYYNLDTLKLINESEYTNCIKSKKYYKLLVKFACKNTDYLTFEYAINLYKIHVNSNINYIKYFKLAFNYKNSNLMVHMINNKYIILNEKNLQKTFNTIYKYDSNMIFLCDEFKFFVNKNMKQISEMYNNLKIQNNSQKILLLIDIINKNNQNIFDDKNINFNEYPKSLQKKIKTIYTIYSINDNKLNYMPIEMIYEMVRELKILEYNQYGLLEN